MSYQPLVDGKVNQHVPYGAPTVVTMGGPATNVVTMGGPVTVLAFNPLDNAAALPYRNSFEPFIFRVFTLVFLALAYCLYILLAVVLPIAVSDGFAFTGIMIGAAFPVMLFLGFVLYFAKPDYFVKVDRVAMELQITKTRSGGYCANGPHVRVPISAIQNVAAVRADTCRSGRTWTIHVTLTNGAVEQLTPLNDLTEARAHTEANKLMNAVRLCRGEPMILHV